MSEEPDKNSTTPAETQTSDDAAPKSLLSQAGDDEDRAPDQTETGADDTDDTTASDDSSDSDDDTPDAPEPLTAESFTFPEGVEPDTELLDGALALFNDTELAPQERAQKLIDLQIEATQKAADAAETAGQAAWDETQSQWQTEALALPLIGGDKLDQTLATIKSGLEQVGATKETFAALDLTGAGNNPQIIAVLHALTAPLAEGGPIGGQPTKGPLTQADRLYGSSAK